MFFRTVSHFEMKRVSYIAVVTVVLATVVTVAVTDNTGGNDSAHSGIHDNSSHDNGHGNGSHHEHHGIHVASLQFDYVRQPLIVSLFMIAVVLCKLGEHFVDMHLF